MKQFEVLFTGSFFENQHTKHTFHSDSTHYLFPYQFRFNFGSIQVQVWSGWAKEERSMGGEWEVTREQNGSWQRAGLQLAMRLLSGRHALLGWSLLSAPFLQIYVVSPAVATGECPRYQRGITGGSRDQPGRGLSLIRQRVWTMISNHPSCQCTQ